MGAVVFGFLFLRRAPFSPVLQSKSFFLFLLYCLILLTNPTFLMFFWSGTEAALFNFLVLWWTYTAAGKDICRKQHYHQAGERQFRFSVPRDFEQRTCRKENSPKPKGVFDGEAAGVIKSERQVVFSQSGKACRNDRTVSLLYPIEIKIGQAQKRRRRNGLQFGMFERQNV